MTDLWPLLARDRYSDQEWALAKAGKCDWLIASYPHDLRCGEPSSPKSFYRWCDEHDERARRDDPYTYGR